MASRRIAFLAWRLNGVGAALVLSGGALLATTPGRASIELVSEGRPAAVIVIADAPTAVARYAAQELVDHIARATGARLTVATESLAPPTEGARVYLGDTRAACAVGIDVRKLAPETAVLRTAGNALFIAGGDAAGDPVETGTYAGTLLGVYEWLETDVGVRWLWPGELGTVVPKSRTIAVREVDRAIAPAFFQRNVRAGLSFHGEHAGTGFTPAAAAQYARDLAVFLRRHRMGKSVRLSYGHAFTDWWRKYGADHPEWFQLLNGKRGPAKPGGSYSMCVSNPEFQAKIVELWRQQREADPAGDHHFVNAVENGIMGLCECENCRAWDGPTPSDYLKYYPPKSKVIGSRFVTDRYAHYWLEVQRAAAQIDPAATVVVYNYFNYFPPPSPGVKLNARILVGSYPSAGWFPRAPGEQEWFKAQWVRWQETGARLFSRGNYCLDGYTMPLIFAHQFADEFQHQARHGMEATDYDALTGQWATQGTNLYLLMRLHTRPAASADDLLAEYYSAFGAAAPMVKEYFDYWEQYGLQHRAGINGNFEDNTSRWRAWAGAAHLVYPPESFAPAEAILTRATELTAGDAEANARVAFLQAGLTHARLCLQVSRLLTVREANSTPERGQAALAELIAFRHAHERQWIANFNHCAWVEDSSWRWPAARNSAGQNERQPVAVSPAAASSL